MIAEHGNSRSTAASSSVSILVRLEGAFIYLLEHPDDAECGEVDA